MFQDAVSFKQTLCGAAWVHSKANQRDMFVGSYGSILPTVCTSVRDQPVSSRSVPERELIVRTRITPVGTPVITSTIMVVTCPKCGKFQKSGRVSCCAPGGAWYKNCGGVGNRNVDHRWFAGVEACKRKFNVHGMYMEPCSDCHKVFRFVSLTNTPIYEH